jgi:hypothetical protein
MKIRHLFFLTFVFNKIARIKEFSITISKKEDWWNISIWAFTYNFAILIPPLAYIKHILVFNKLKYMWLCIAIIIYWALICMAIQIVIFFKIKII